MLVTKESFQPGVFQSLCSLPNVDVKGELVTSVTFDRHSLALDMFFFVISVFVSIVCFRMIFATNRFHHLPHLATSDFPCLSSVQVKMPSKLLALQLSWRKLDVPFHPTCRSWWNVPLQTCDLHQVLTGKKSFPG